MSRWYSEMVGAAGALFRLLPFLVLLTFVGPLLVLAEKLLGLVGLEPPLIQYTRWGDGRGGEDA